MTEQKVPLVVRNAAWMPQSVPEKGIWVVPTPTLFLEIRGKCKGMNGSVAENILQFEGHGT